MGGKEKELLSKEQALLEREASLQQETKRQRREAEAKATQGLAYTKWANEFVHGEEGEILEGRMGRSISTMARLLDTGLLDPAEASRAAAAKELQACMPPAQLPVLEKGASVWYTKPKGDGDMVPATITAVHTEVAIPYYTIKIDGAEGERQTERVNVVSMAMSMPMHPAALCARY